MFGQKNLPFSIEDVNYKGLLDMFSMHKTTPQFHHLNARTLIKATQLFECSTIDFKGPLPSCFQSTCLLVVIDEFLHFPFCYPCPNMRAETVIKCLTLNYSRWCILYTIFTNSAPLLYFEILQAASATYPLINSTGML